MNAAELFVRCLEAEGVDTIFGLPGEENAHFMMALETSPSIRFVLTRHEQVAAFMADVYGRLTGKAGVCLGTLGPGATNLTTGVADANMDRAPCVVITGQADSKRQHKESHQNMDVVGMFEPITKWATPLRNPENVPEVVRKAFKLAEAEKPGACHIELAEDIADLPAEGTPLLPQKVRRPVPDDKVMDRVVGLLREAKSPVILAGNGTIRKRASAQLRRFCEATNVPVINTFMGKGCVSREAPYSLFTIGLQARDHVSCALDAADVVICLGYDLVEYHPRLWNSDPARHRVVHIDFLPAEVDEFYRPEVEVVGDLAHALWMMNERVEREPLRFDSTQAARVRADMLADFAEWKDDDAVGAIKPQKALWDVREVLGPDDLLLSDVGAHKMWIARYYQCDEPNTCLIPNGFCSMGFALPGAMAAKLIHPERRVLALAGDAGFLMNSQDMETAARLGTNIVCMVWEDNAYGLIAWKQEGHFGRHTELSFSNPDWVKLAEAYGWAGMRCEDSTRLQDTLESAFAADRPALVVVPIDYRENAKLSDRLGQIACAI
ncbi:MAG: acetolactate synthase large subunit [Planctomycetota bacterium]